MSTTLTQREQAIYAWGFKVTTFPAPPTGFNQGSPDPAPEKVQTASIEMVDIKSKAFNQWLSDLMKHAQTKDPLGLFGMILMVDMAIKAGNLRLDTAPWPDLVKKAGTNPPTESVQLTALAKWVPVFLLNNEGGGSATHSVQTKTGVTSSKSTTKSFSTKVGVSVTAGWGPVSATVSTEFTKSTSTTNSISFTEEQTLTTSFTFPANSFTQVWQLTMMVEAGDNGPALEQGMEIYSQLSFPRNDAGEVTDADLQAMLQNTLATATA